MKRWLVRKEKETKAEGVASSQEYKMNDIREYA